MGTRIAATSRREVGGDWESGGAERQADGQEALDDVEPPTEGRISLVNLDGTER